MFFNAERRVLFVNQVVEAVTGRPGSTLEEALEPDHPLRHMVEQALERGASVRNVRIVLPGDGGDRELLASVFPVPSTGQGFGGAIALLKDPRSIAVSPRTLQSLIRYAAQLTALGQLTSGVTHDIKNPLNAMMIHAHLLEGKLADAPEDIRRSLEVIRGEIGRLDTVVQRFMTLVRPQELAANEFDLNALLQEVVSLLEAEWRAKGVRFATELDRDLPLVVGDEEVLRRAFLNIVLNGCEAMSGGGRVTIRSESVEEGLAKVTVTDTGTGIPAEDLDKIFTMYYTTKLSGSGIGLALVRRIMEAHRGDIEVFSELGAGTAVVVRLPLRGAP